MATHSSTLAWKIPQTEEPSRLAHGIAKSQTRLSDLTLGLPRWCSGKEPACSAGDTWDASLIPGSGSSPGVGNGNPLQYSCLKHPMDREAWGAIAHGVAKRYNWATGQAVSTVWPGILQLSPNYSCCFFCLLLKTFHIATQSINNANWITLAPPIQWFLIFSKAKSRLLGMTCFALHNAVWVSSLSPTPVAQS